MHPSSFHQIHPQIFPAPQTHWRSILGSIVLLSLVKPARIGPPITDGAIFAADGSAPLFFLWVQQLLLLGDPFLWGVLLLVGVLACLVVFTCVLPQASPSELGRWFHVGNRLAQDSFLFPVGSIRVLTLLGLR